METNVLVAYFSCTNVTRKVAADLAAITKGDLFAITPQDAYTKEDLDWQNKNSRTSKEKEDPSFRPAIANSVAHMEKYDTIYLGFPIWWYKAPNIILTFLESYDFSGKTIIPFCTSGESDFGSTVSLLKKVCSETAVWKTGRVCNGHPSRELLTGWVHKL
ncbi:flavodoxin [Megasphaera vaginalis (ex Bordigoni et al. 2020)]|uniref:flavodoxin n=1 Tax=Megasphaera vaginalis (ex Bordigoni et al. 2020) TaxID=2045301 RepID=UPI000C7BD412|nr:flavodoxin [Megasphaera vaginalis (ex Bordigoni et al. 2020)]